MRPIALTLTLGAALAASSVATAQGPGPMSGPPGGMPKPTPEQMAKFKEFQAVKTQLDGIRDKAMKDPKLQKKEKALRDTIDAAMVKEDPKAKEKREKFEALNAQFEAARAKGDTAAAQKIAGEVRPLLQSLDTARRKVMADEKVTAAVDAFRDAVMAKMKKIDPQTPKLLAKAEKLSGELQAAMRAAGVPPMPQ